MKLKLEKPIIFFDLETTGLTIGKDRIVELCYIRLEPNGCERAEVLRFNPGMHIPKEASDIHGIMDNETLRIEVADPSRPGVIRPADDNPDDEVLMLLMPMRVED